ncbi:polar amino acid transport system substrate-binding protein [Pilibacter termitis]|uniref:Polar amino acid transport system substrate-binding protein n=1 Tax=Pilibacter termitis TaxID=263852 RepID=A0A1T4MEG2_9ENTE|nr:amino acid ABC transporter substrate-binding protein/permease [Pilibacter termitis]SJZ65271.1 polar amino acid transport system substrate-binding protein [Pilibacter termitis]
MNKRTYLAEMVLTVLAFFFVGTFATKAEEKVYTIVLDSTYAPFEYQAEDGSYAGIDVDLLDAISKSEGFKVEKKFPGFQAAVDQVQAGQADGIIAGMSITDERKKSFTFSEPYFDSSIEIATKKSAKDIKTLDDLKGKKVGVKNGTVSQEWLVKNEKTYGYSLKIFDEGSQMYDALNINDVVAIMDDAPVIDYAITQGKNFATPFKPVPIGHYGFAVKKGKNEELVKMFDKGLKKLKENGKYDKILAKYVGNDEKATEESEKKEEKTYTIVLDSTYAPFEYQAEDGSYAGIDVDLLDAISKSEGFKVEKKFPGFQAAVDQVQAGQADGIIAGMSITDERKKSFTFSEPYFDSSIEIAIKKSTKNIKTLDDLKGKKVGVKNGTVSQEWLVKNEKTYGYSLKIFDEGSQMYDALNINDVVAIMDDAPVIDYAITQGKDFATPFKPVPIGHYGFAVKKGTNEELVKMFDKGLQKLKENGEYDKILAKYVGGEEATQEAEKKESVDESTFSGLLSNNWEQLLKGLGNTLVIALVSFVLAMIVGVVFGLFSVAPIKALRVLSSIYVDIIRGVPLMVLAVFIFYGLPNVFPILKLNDFVAGILALTLNASAYIAEIVRGGINAVPAGQMEASRSLGLGYTRTMQKIILPQAIRIMVPSLVNQFVISLKDTTIISVIGVIELLQAGKIIVGRNLQSFRVYLIVGVMYLVVITALTKLSKVLERRMK